MSRQEERGTPLPDVSRSVVVEAPGSGAGYRAGGPSAVLAGGVFHLASRLRRPVGDGRATPWRGPQHRLAV